MKRSLVIWSCAAALTLVVGACGTQPRATECGRAKREFGRIINEIDAASSALEQEPAVTRIERAVSVTQMRTLLSQLNAAANDVERACGD
jgi:hypothetical protein